MMNPKVGMLYMLYGLIDPTMTCIGHHPPLNSSGMCEATVLMKQREETILTGGQKWLENPL